VDVGGSDGGMSSGSGDLVQIGHDIPSYIESIHSSTLMLVDFKGPNLANGRPQFRG
jgi:hypothetical protein